jgi:uroporphyrinogen III methyltransferase/synthase
MEALARRLRQEGAQVLEQPAIAVHPREVNDEIHEAYQQLGDGGWDCLVFTSPAGVQIFFEMLLAQDMDSRSLCGCRIACIGTGTAAALKEHGLLADEMPKKFDGESLGSLLGEVLSDGSRVLIPRSSIGNPKLISSMEARGAVFGKRFFIRDLAIYDTQTAKRHTLAGEPFAAGEIPDGIFFTSASTVRGFLEQYPGVDVKELTALCMGRMTAEAAREAGMQVRIAQEATVDGLLALAKR